MRISATEKIMHQVISKWIRLHARRSSEHQQRHTCMIMRVVLTTGLKLTMRARLRVNGKLSAPADNTWNNNRATASSQNLQR